MSTFFDKVKSDTKVEIGSHHFDAASIKAFAAKFDPQYFHLDEEAAKKSNFGGLCASGWHTVSIWQKLNIENGRRLLREACDYYGEATYGPSPGVRNLNWLWPVFAGDTITYTTELKGAKDLPNHPDWFLLLIRNEGHNQSGRNVVEFDGSVMIKRD